MEQRLLILLSTYLGAVVILNIIQYLHTETGFTFVQ